MIDRNIFISNMPVEEALVKYNLQLENPLRNELISVHDGLGRKTSKAIFAQISSPHYHSAAMDGIAVKSSDTYGASLKEPKLLMVDKHYVCVNTGNPIPEHFDSVIMIEDVVEISKGVIQILEPSFPWQHIRQVGEDIINGEMVLPSNHKIRPLDFGALLSAGIQQIEVVCRLKVGILPTGNEIVRDAYGIKSGQILDSSSSVFKGIITEYGGVATVYHPVSDDLEKLRAAIKCGIEENDMLVVIAGSSAGTKDFTAQIIEELGEVIVHGVALKPGKPTILGKIYEKSVVGLPGYPVSSYFAFQTFVKPLIEKWLDEYKDPVNKVAILSKRVNSSLKHVELVRVTLGEVDGKLIATPLNRGAGATMSLVKADGILSVPRLIEGIESGAKVDVTLMKSIEEITKRLVFIGSHDLIIDVIADSLPISSGHVGSLAGVLAMKRGECHLAPIHLIDEETGAYNLSTMKKYFPKGDMVLIEGVKRLQGLMVKKGNPKNIQGFNDLVNPEIQYINRQRGSGTRQLLDYELKKNNIDSHQIIGYTREMNTHMAVAVSVLSEGVDCALGVYSAASTMKLDFIPLCYESYDFIIPKSMLEDERVIKFIEILQSDNFKIILNNIGGYELKNPGQIMEVGEGND